MEKQDRQTSFFDTLAHGIFRLPYRLTVRFKRVKNPLKPTYLLLHGLADTGELWQPLLERLPEDANYIVVDLLGHGSSKHPKRSVYSAREQARHVFTTCVSLGVVGPVIVIGHSFGSLVAVELARKHPLLVKQLVLCAPPIYREPDLEKKNRLQQEVILRSIYKQLSKMQKPMITAYDIASKLKLLGFSKTQVTKENYPALVETLKSGIISQTAGKHLETIQIPTAIVYGAFDPLLVGSNLRKLSRINPNVSIKSLPTGHSISPLTVTTILKTLDVKKSAR